MCIWNLVVYLKSEKKGDLGISWAKHISWSSLDTWEKKEIFHGETRVNIIFNENFVLNKYPLTFMPLTQKKLFAFLMEANHSE